MSRVARELESRSAAGRPGDAVRGLEGRCREFVRLFKERVLQQVVHRSVDQALGEARRERRQGPTPFSCEQCGERRGHELRRNGHYRRRPMVAEGQIELKVPQLLCVDCGKSVSYEHPLLPRRRRLWLDIDQHLAELYLEGMSYRGARRVLERRASTSVGLMTLWRGLQRVGATKHAAPANEQSEFVGLDEVYMRVKGKPRWFLTARGQTKKGGKNYLGSVLSEDRSQAAWETALAQLGISGYNPPFAIMSDGDAAIEAAVQKALPGAKTWRCVWHIEHNAAEWVEERHPGPEDKGLRKGLMAGVREIVDAPSLEAREESLRVLDEVAGWLTARLRRALERVPPKGGAVKMRTNNLMERGFRELRRRTRPMDGFKSTAGASNFYSLWMLKENARCNGRDYLPELLP